MQFVLTTVLLIAALIVACADLRELFIGWYSGESITLWQASFLLARGSSVLGRRARCFATVSDRPLKTDGSSTVTLLAIAERATM